GAASALPAGATINPSSGIFSWRPLVSQANTTSLIQIEVTDNGQPNLSATNSFNVVVNPITAPVVSSVTPNSSELDLVVNGPSGPDYTLLSSTDLVNWQSMLTISSPTPPVTLSDTNYPDGPVRFYRVAIGP
ncbi:MAG TPA: putative Ig domain-containing protein, partial [Verrucomicrobiae bacterium]|nr:putative Ig domain-containing protein [Verrucomicrobiae bacterium]